MFCKNGVYHQHLSLLTLFCGYEMWFWQNYRELVFILGDLNWYMYFMHASVGEEMPYLNSSC